jgi:hypothetical protein
LFAIPSKRLFTLGLPSFKPRIFLDFALSTLSLSVYYLKGPCECSF